MTIPKFKNVWQLVEYLSKNKDMSFSLQTTCMGNWFVTVEKFDKDELKFKSMHIPHSFHNTPEDALVDICEQLLGIMNE